MTEHLPALLIIVPLLAAPICMILRHGRAAWALAVLAVWASLVIAWTLLPSVLAQGTLSYHLGGWEPPGASNTGSTRPTSTCC